MRKILGHNKDDSKEVKAKYTVCSLLLLSLSSLSFVAYIITGI